MYETRRILSHLMFHFVLTFSICMTIKLGWAWQQVGTFLKFANDRNRNILFSEFYKDYFLVVASVLFERQKVAFTISFERCTVLRYKVQTFTQGTAKDCKRI